MWIGGLFLLVVVFLVVNLRVKKTNAYQNFARTIHVVKDVPNDKKYKIAAFGSTFSYYAYDIKKYGGHNFSVEPQSMVYMRKTIKHFVGNIEENGYALISLAGCFFAAESTVTDEQCLTYYSFLEPKEFDHYDKKLKIKYLLKRYFPILSPHYVISIFKDEPRKYSVQDGIGYDKALAMAQRRVKGWEKVVRKPINAEFKVDGQLENVLQRNVERMKDIIRYVRANKLHPVFVILPMSEAFNKVCPNKFYDEILFRCLDALNEEKVPVLNYLYDEDLCKLDNYYTADCLNLRGRQQLSEKIISDLNVIRTK